MSKERISANIYGDMLGDKTARVMYENPEGKKMDISFHWHTKKIGSGGYFSMDENYMEIHVSERRLAKSNEIYSDKRKIGEDTWISRQAGSGSKENGIQTFDEFLQNKDAFNYVADEKLRAVLYKAQGAAREAMHNYYENYRDNKYNQNKLSDVRKKLAEKANKILGTHLEERKMPSKKLGIGVQKLVDRIVSNKKING